MVLVSFFEISSGFWSTKMLIRRGLHVNQDLLGQAQPFKSNLNKKLDPKQKTIQTFNIDAKRFRKTKNENSLPLEIGVTS